MLLKIFRLTILLLTGFSAYAQNPVIVDSLSREIKNAKHDSVKVRLLNELSAHYLFTNTTGARNPAIESLDLSEKTGNSKGKMDALSRLGVMHFRLANYDSSIIFYQKGLRHAESVNDTTYILKYRGNIALSLSGEGKYQEALKEYFSIINLQKKFSPATVSKNILDMASIYYHLKDYKNAYKWALESKELAEKYNDQKTLANAYGSLGVFFKELGKTEEALTCHKVSYKMKKEQGDISGQINSLINIGTILQEKEDYPGSLKITDTVILLAKETGAVNQQANALINRGVIFTYMEQYEKANESFKEALSQYRELGSLNGVMLTTEKLGSNAIRRRNFEEAAMFLQESLTLKDSLYGINMADAIAEMRTKFDTEKKEQENLQLLKDNELKNFMLAAEVQHRRNQFYLFIAAGVVVLLLFLLIFIRFRNKKKSELEKQRSMGLKAVIEAEEKERIRIARELHDGLGQMLSTARVNIAALEGEVNPDDEKLVTNSLTVIDDSIKEVRNISHKMMPVALIEFGLIKAVDVLVMRINEARAMTIQFHHNGIDRLEQSVEISIYRIIQEVLNNIIKHSDAKNIMIDLHKSGTKILLKINDDGKGFNTGDIGKSKGIGWNNIYSRLSVINGNMDVQSDPGRGTVINIDFTI